MLWAAPSIARSMGTDVMAHQLSSSVQDEHTGTSETSLAQPAIECLLQWVREATGDAVVDWHQISGGNRCQSFTVLTRDGAGSTRRYYLRYQLPRSASVERYTVLREAAIYRLLERNDVPAARLIAVNPDLSAVLLDHIDGIAEYRRLSDKIERETIAMEFTDALARLHARPLDLEDLPEAAERPTMADAARAEVAEWKAMYEETGIGDPLIDLSLQWLQANVPADADAPVLVHGDAGPGNFLFKDGHLSGLIDWEFAHPGDWHDDLAWFSMRCVMEPVPDFAACLRRYEASAAATIDLARLRFYQILVSTRVLIIRHRNVSGEPGNSIVSKALNRRLLIAALAAANNVAMPTVSPPKAMSTEHTELYDFVIASLRDDISMRSDDKQIVASAKNLAKVAKYLSQVDRYSTAFDNRELAMLTRTLGERPATKQEGYFSISRGVQKGEIELEIALQIFSECVQYDTILAAPASGRIAQRSWPQLI